LQWNIGMWPHSRINNSFFYFVHLLLIWNKSLLNKGTDKNYSAV
jgi:hypothetical protein